MSPSPALDTLVLGGGRAAVQPLGGIRTLAPLSCDAYMPFYLSRATLIPRSAACPPPFSSVRLLSSNLLLTVPLQRLSCPRFCLLSPSCPPFSRRYLHCCLFSLPGISVLLSCSRNQLIWLRSPALFDLLLLLGRSTSSCVFPWPRALGHSCQPPRWGWRRLVLPPPSSRVCCSRLLRPHSTPAYAALGSVGTRELVAGEWRRLATLLSVFQHGCSREASWVWPGRSRICWLGRGRQPVKAAIAIILP
jgi:hypothetical protein